jgi:REP element-mobilizing transposase RayT
MKSAFYDGPFYHVYNRGAHKSQIFFSEENYGYCLKLISKYSLSYKVDILAYCLMPNHYHLLVRQQPGGSVARFLQTTFNAYVQAVNKQQGLHGALFESSAQSLNVDTEAYLLELVCYIHLNPVTANLVKFPQDWKFSDYGVWIGIQATLSASPCLRHEYFESGEAYRLYVDAYIHERSSSAIRQLLFDEDDN